MEVREPAHDVAEALTSALLAERRPGAPARVRRAHERPTGHVVHHEVQSLCREIVDNCMQPDDIWMAQLLHHGDLVADSLEHAAVAAGVRVPLALLRDLQLAEGLEREQFAVGALAQPHGAKAAAPDHVQLAVEEAAATIQKAGWPIVASTAID